MDDEINLSDVVRKAHQYRWIIVSIMAICISVGVYFDLTAVPEKDYTTTVEIGRYVNNDGVFAFEDPEDIVSRIKASFPNIRISGKRSILSISSSDKETTERIAERIIEDHQKLSQAFQLQEMYLVSKTRLIGTKPYVVTPERSFLRFFVSGVLLTITYILFSEAVKWWRSEFSLR